MTSVDMEIIEEDFPASAALKVERQRGYGAVAGLADEELADPQELERRAFADEWGPILALPFKDSRGVIRPTLDEFGQVDWGPFGTVDFARIRPPFDKARYKVSKLREELRIALIRMSTVQERLSMAERLAVLDAIRGGVDDPDYFDGDKSFYARRYLCARRLRREIHQLHEYISRRSEDGWGWSQ